VLTTPGAIAGEASWDVALSLGFDRTARGTVLARRRHDGPLVVQKALYPEGRDVCHAAIVHAPGGIAGGDRLALDIDLSPGAHVLLTTPAATRWYKAAGREARQTVAANLAETAVLEWLPQETIVFDQAQARNRMTVALDATSVYAGWEITCLGRRASGECFESGYLKQRVDITRRGRPIWTERLAFLAGDRLLHSPMGLNGRHVSGTMVVAASALPGDLLEACRAIRPASGDGATTALPDVIVARYLGGSAEHAQAYFESLRTILRPWYAGRPALRPRLWDT
jgi:urease accessory protein